MYDEKYGLMSSTKRIKDIENALGLKLSDESLRKAASTD
jgi:cell division protein FtsL